MSRAHVPPRFPRALLRLAVPGEARDAVDGDLHELYLARRAASGATAAAIWYWLETLSFGTRFTFDRVVRANKRLAGGDATPSALDL